MYNIITRQLSGNIINLLKGRISEDEYNNNNALIETHKVTFYNSIDQIINSNIEELESGNITSETLDCVIDSLSIIPLIKNLKFI